MTNIRTVNIKGKSYVDVAERVRLVHETRESFEIVSSGPLQVGTMWVWQAAILVDGKHFIGTAEIKFDAPKNTADGTNPVACAETSAVGRALGMAGLGSLESISSADEVQRAIAEQERGNQKSQKKARLNAIFKTGKAKGLYGSKDEMAEYLSEAIGRDISGDDIPTLVEEELVWAEQAVEAAQGLAQTA